MRKSSVLEICQSQDKDVLGRRLVNAALEMQFGLVNAFLVVEREGENPDVLYIGNRPINFENESSDDENVNRDPVLRRLQQQNLPFIYDQSTYVEAGAGDMWEGQAQFGYRNGLAVCLHMPDRKHFVLCLSREQPMPKSERQVMRLLADLQLLAVHCQEAAVKILGAEVTQRSSVSDEERSKLALQARLSRDEFGILQGTDGADVRLTPREREILRWTMAGKSGSVVAQILGVSHGAVKFHVSNAMTKLNAASKHSAVMKAVALGLL